MSKQVLAVPSMYGPLKVEVEIETDIVLCRMFSSPHDLGMTRADWEGRFGSNSWSDDPSQINDPQVAASTYVYTYLGIDPK